MIYDVTLKIGYDYPSAVKDARHILRVRPRRDWGQTVAAATMRIGPKPDEAVLESDFFGNELDHVLLFSSHKALSTEMKARVEVARAAPALDRTPPLDRLIETALLSRDAGAEGPMHFLGDSRIVRRAPDVTAYVREGCAGHGTAGAALLALTKLIRKDFKYAPGATTVDTRVDEAFKRRKGVCQDFAHVMIAGLRGFGVPAAYVSGFLRTTPPPGRPRLEGADAMHAWVAAWLGEPYGWVGFDPTNGVLALDDHIVVAIGRDYSDVAPIDGVLMTSGPQKTQHSVDVAPVAEVAA